ncbi:MAG: hypothetical protein IPG96_13580 [Proteobacteria bacterium]|nr:hypothetical protein [Pseudomonadota bacterium]
MRCRVGRGALARAARARGGQLERSRGRHPGCVGRDDFGVGATAGRLAQVIPRRLNVGVGYRSVIKLYVEGAAVFAKAGSAGGGAARAWSMGPSRPR